MVEVLAGEKRICNTKDSWDDIQKEQMEKPNLVKHRIQSALEDRHMGLFEHISLTFLIEGVSRNMTHQLVRHRIASYLQTSQRVTDMNELELIVPSSIPQHLRQEWSYHLEDAIELYNDAIDAGVPLDDARYIMPHGMETRIVMTINARSLMHFLKLRLGEHAQWEIAEVARQMLTLAKGVYPLVFDEKYRECWE